MKVYEAQEMLANLDPNLDVVLTIGKPKKEAPFPREPKYQQAQPHWVIDHEFWKPQRKEIACKLH